MDDLAEEDLGFLGGLDDGGVLKQFLAQGGVPAFVNRSQRIQEAWNKIKIQCERQRDEWRGMVRLRIGTLKALVVQWQYLLPLLQDKNQIAKLEELHQEMKPELRSPPKPTLSMKQFKKSLLELVESLNRFNHRWQGFVENLDLGGINKLRRKYNEYYILEKECLVRSPLIARKGFQPLPPLTHQDLLAEFPLLRVPILK